MRPVRKILLYLRFLWNSVFMGMSSADSVIKGPSVRGSSPESVRHQETGGVFSDFLKGKETEQTVEMRDKMYRVMRESEKYDVSGIAMNIDENSGEMEFITPHHLKRKSKADFANHAEVMNPEGYPIRTIQDNRKGETRSMFSMELPKGAYDFTTTVGIVRDGVTPRFPIEKYAKRVVVRTVGGPNCLVDIYLPYHSSQFGKVDAILISNLHHMMETGEIANDITDIQEISWHSDKAWNSEDLCLFEYRNLKPVGIAVFDGSFVLTFSAECVADGKYIGEKYETQALTGKYTRKEAKDSTVDMRAAMRLCGIDENGMDSDADEYSTVRLSIK